MALASTAQPQGFAFTPAQRNLAIWALALIVFVLLWQLGPSWTKEWPATALLPAKIWIGGLMKWLVDGATFGLFTFQQATRFVAAIIEVPYAFVLGLIATGLTPGPSTSAAELGVQMLGLVTVIVVSALFGWLSQFGRRVMTVAALVLIGVAIVVSLVMGPAGVIWLVHLGMPLGELTIAIGNAIGPLTPIPWIAVIGGLTLLGHWAGGVRLALIVAVSLLFVLLFGQWETSMVTLASIAIAVPLGAIGGLLLGIAAYRAVWFERAITPVLDLMQTVPVFAYLVPVLFLFGFGPTAAIVATIIYAMPPMTRLTLLALRGLPPEIGELGRMVGATSHQRMWRVLLPVAMPGLMVGVNQVIMLSLNIAIIASMIGAGGIGFEVLSALRRLDFGVGFEAGFSIVALAIMLDRLSQAVARKLQDPRHRTHDDRSWLVRHPHAVATLVLLIATLVAGLFAPAVRTYPEAWQLSTGDFWARIIEWINVSFFDQLEGIKNFVVLTLLVPFKRFLLELPWAGVAGLIAFAGYRLGGWKLALLTGALSTLIAATGQWEKAMITVYLCGISVVFAALIGIPIGILAAQNRRIRPVVDVIVDTLQTLPSFVYLMPVVMLFRVGDFTAMLAVIAYAIAPAIRYTTFGLTRVEPSLLEAGKAIGATRWQVLTKVKLKLALPEILLGINQTIMLALSMLVITALVGTRDLGQEVYVALAKADTGRGIVAGLAVAFIAIIADRLIGAAAARSKARLGLA